MTADIAVPQEVSVRTIRKRPRRHLPLRSRRCVQPLRLLPRSPIAVRTFRHGRMRYAKHWMIIWLKSFRQPRPMQRTQHHRIISIIVRGHRYCRRDPSGLGSLGLGVSYLTTENQWEIAASVACISKCCIRVFDISWTGLLLDALVSNDMDIEWVILYRLYYL